MRALLEAGVAPITKDAEAWQRILLLQVNGAVLQHPRVVLTWKAHKNVLKFCDHTQPETELNKKNVMCR